jgi:arylsulfatase A-like enzyme
MHCSAVTAHCGRRFVDHWRALFVGILAAALTQTTPGVAAEGESPGRPNVLLILTDDQGWGDFGFHGNQQIQTPRIDALARESVELEWFYVSPVCSPTRASLLTGRYNYRTGVLDTNMGRSMMYGEEVTLAEMLSSAGYRTAIFGKWHLGDNYPLRPIDQGFDEALVHRGGGLGQPSDPPGNSYFDPTLEHNGRPEKIEGYISDALTSAALGFIGEPSDRPFFVYLAFNCPHVPLQIAEHYWKPYVEAGIDEPTAKVYGMIGNIDENLGRVFDRLAESGQDRNTIVIFLTDNGPQGRRYNGPLRDEKTSLYEGGIRVPCLVRWPGKLDAGKKVSQPAAHIDIVPTLLEACRCELPAGIRLDGRSLWPLLTGQSDDWPERNLYIQFHRGDVPELYRGFAARGPRYKLVQPVGGDPALVALKPRFELFDLENDPGERRDLAAMLDPIVSALKSDYAAWFGDVAATRGFDPPRIVLGTKHENPATLTRQDWRGPRAGWKDDSQGHWDVTLATAGRYDFILRMPPTKVDFTARLMVGDLTFEQPVAAGSREHVFRGIRLPAGPARLEAAVGSEATPVGPHYLDVFCRELDESK